MATLCTHWPYSGNGSGTWTALIPVLLASHEAPPSSVRPVLPVRMVPQAADQLVGPAAVGGSEQRRRLDPGVDHVRLARRAGRQLPCPGQGFPGVLREGDRGVVGLLPGRAQVIAGGHTRPE